MTVTVRFHFGHLDRMPRCAVCGRAICHHSDLEFAGLVPALPSAAAPLPGGSGLEGGSHSALQPFATRSPVTGSDIAETALAARGSRQSSDDLLSQQTNVDRIFHEGEFI